MNADTDLRCHNTVEDVLFGIDCILDRGHAGDHTDGDGTFWDDDGTVEFRPAHITVEPEDTGGPSPSIIRPL